MRLQKPHRPVDLDSQFPVTTGFAGLTLNLCSTFRGSSAPPVQHELVRRETKPLPAARPRSKF